MPHCGTLCQHYISLLNFQPSLLQKRYSQKKLTRKAYPADRHSKRSAVCGRTIRRVLWALPGRPGIYHRKTIDPGASGQLPFSLEELDAHSVGRLDEREAKARAEIHGVLGKDDSLCLEIVAETVKIAGHAESEVIRSP